MLDERWPAVCDVGPALIQHWVKMSCLLGYPETVITCGAAVLRELEGAGRARVVPESGRICGVLVRGRHEYPVGSLRLPRVVLVNKDGVRPPCLPVHSYHQLRGHHLKTMSNHWPVRTDCCDWFVLLICVTFISALVTCIIWTWNCKRNFQLQMMKNSLICV